MTTETYSSELVKDLLTENRFWSFSSTDWSIRVNIFWGGKTKWEDVVKQTKEEMRKRRGRFHSKAVRLNEVYYERQVQLKQPDITFE